MSLSKKSPPVVKNTGITYQVAEDILNKKVMAFFPKSGMWYNSCFRRPKEITKINMPCHLRDSKWLAEYWCSRLTADLVSIPYEYVLYYIETSPLFADKRHEYELKIVKYEIEQLKKGGVEYVLPNGFDNTFINDRSCDKLFRDGVLKTLCAIGMNKDVVEEGIERYAMLWREQFMEIAFDNRYNPINYSSSLQFLPASESHKSNWIKMREYKYYQDHKDVMDKNGLITDAMRMTNTEVSKLSSILKKQNKAREQEIEAFCSSRNIQHLSKLPKEDEKEL